MALLSKWASKVSKFRSVVRERDKVRHRSSGWEAVRDAHLANSPACVACGGEHLLQVHHIVPFSTAPDLELEPSNLITLCMGEFDCHLKLGHGGSFRHYNPRVIAAAAEFREAELGRREALIKEARAWRLD